MMADSLSYKTNSFPQQKPSLRLNVSADEDDTELSIFDAKRYFNDSNNDSRLCKRVSPLNIPNLPFHASSEAEAGAGRFSSASSGVDGYGYGRTYRVRSFHATPTPSSEASWNSQTGLLSNPTGAIAVSMTTRTTGDKRKGSGKIRWLWLRRCPCSGKKSVQVEPKTTLSLNEKVKVDDDDHNRKEIPLTPEENHEFHSSLGQRVVATTRVPLMMSNGTSGTGHGGGGFTFPILNQQPKPSHFKMAVIRNNSTSLDDHDELPRESLEVFVPPGDAPKKLVSRITIQDDDVASDTSSDLFEIESLSTTTQGQSQTTSYPMYNRRDSLDDALNMRSMAACSNGGSSGFGGGCSYSPMVAEGYEPSEASIEWSVTTAEGFERASVGVSEAAEEIHFNYNGNGYSHRYGGKKRSENGGLLSCRSEKAVSVGPNPVKYVPPRGQTGTTLKHVGNVKHPQLSRLSLPFSA